MNHLTFIDPSVDAFLAGIEKSCAKGSNGRKTLAVVGSSPLKAEIERRCAGECSAVSLVNDSAVADVVCCVSVEAEQLSADLMSVIDRQGIDVIAPITSAHYQRRPLYTISVPKSGTHLVFELVQAMGFGMNHFSTTQPSAGQAYFLEYSNSHTKATSFFIDTVYTSEFGGRDHPFTYTPSLFMYRHPYDILVSEARYYPKKNNTLFYQYLKNLSLEACISKLIDDPFLLGSLRSRLVDYAAWTEFENVIPIAFEDIIGSKGGGDDALRDQLIWSLQLKLHVPGSPSDIGDRIFNSSSPTFNKGQVGGYRDTLTDGHYQQLETLNQDFMHHFGYSKSSPFSERAEAFRRRPLVVPSTPVFPPILIDHDFNGYNIVKFDNRFFGLKLGFGVDFEKVNVNDLPKSKVVMGSTIDEVRAKVLVRAPQKSARERVKALLKS